MAFDPTTISMAASPPPTAAPPARSPRAALRWWGVVLLAALAVALGLRLFVAEAFRIPTASMAGTLEAGDFILVSKLHYGARTPERMRLPFAAATVPGVRLPSMRTPGLATLRRGDVVVFYHPAEAGPVSERTPYVKRAIGLPGDTVAIRAKRVAVNGEPVPMAASAQHDWVVTLEEGGEADGLPSTAVRAGLHAWRIRTTPQAAAALADEPAVAHVEPAAGRPEGALFPPGTDYTPDDFGPVVVPRRGHAMPITDATWPAIAATLDRENRDARRLAPGRFEVDGVETDSVVFERDYLFVLGDNRDDSADSRRWGFVPADHLIGRAVMVYFSSDETGVRFDRMFRRVR